MDEPLAYLNGRFLPQSEARLTLHDAGFVTGVTVTDLCRTFRHGLFRLADHLPRFRAGCNAVGIDRSHSDAELTSLATELAAVNARLLAPDEDLALVLFATPGAVGYYLGEPGGPGDARPTFGIHTFPLPFARYSRLFRQGARLVIPTTRHIAADSIDPRIKHRSRLYWWLAEREARAADPAASALLLDQSGHVTETAAANVLIVRGGRVLTPPRSTVLNGVSLKVTEELCNEAGIPFEERPLAPADCRGADEMLLTSTPYGLCGVGSLDGRPVPWPGPIFERLLAAWNGRVGLDLRRQILRDQ